MRRLAAVKQIIRERILMVSINRCNLYLPPSKLCPYGPVFACRPLDLSVHLQSSGGKKLLSIFKFYGVIKYHANSYLISYNVSQLDCFEKFKKLHAIVSFFYAYN